MNHERVTETGREPEQAASVGNGRTGSPPSDWHKVIRIGIGMAMFIGVLLTAFAWPSSEVTPRDVPIAVVGGQEAAVQVQGQLDAAMPDGFEVEPAADLDAARELIEDRDVYGAIAISPDGPPQVLTASAASPVVAQVIQGIADRMTQEMTGAPAVQVEDVVGHPDDDARGSGFSSAALPMVIGGMAVGYSMSLIIVGVWRRVTGALVGATAGGLVGALVVQPWLGVLDGNYLANAGVLALAIAAISLTIIGLGSLLGPAGLGIGALVMLLLGNPLSGVTTAPEMLPTGWGTLGQLLPPGAGGSLLRSSAFFDGAAAGGPILVLTAWVVLGVVLAALGWAKRERVTVASTSQAVPAGS
ncbi:ABC transporter permease [Phytoactinopolyspora endophytica]|uniref:ABC transporter permease n=1 Tax=Phytoactinopolyspora endophytica TaxID=1642495 RepID=UPI0013EA0A15|nr:ABC transporter permease [Phytoactinopolyspora endophytica]